MNFISFFAGIGGLDLGLERAGHQCVGQCEIDPYALKVLAKHWPDVPRFGDITELNADDLPDAELWCGGFPCQDISIAGKQAGIRGARSGLFFDFMRLAVEVRPRFLLLENVGALINGGLSDVLGTLAESGYDAEWDCLYAAQFGAPHRRERVFILAYTGSQCGQVLHGPTADSLAGRCLSFYEQSGYRWQRDNDGRSLDRVGWSVIPEVRGSDDGIPAGSHGDRLRGLGNAVAVPVAEYLGRLLAAAANCQRSCND